jgi:hypothetical protein
MACSKAKFTFTCTFVIETTKRYALKENAHYINTAEIIPFQFSPMSLD